MSWFPSMLVPFKMKHKLQQQTFETYFGGRSIWYGYSSACRTITIPLSSPVGSRPSDWCKDLASLPFPSAVAAVVTESRFGVAHGVADVDAMFQCVDVSLPAFDAVPMLRGLSLSCRPSNRPQQAPSDLSVLQIKRKICRTSILQTATSIS